MAPIKRTPKGKKYPFSSSSKEWLFNPFHNEENTKVQTRQV